MNTQNIINGASLAQVNRGEFNAHSVLLDILCGTGDGVAMPLPWTSHSEHIRTLVQLMLVERVPDPLFDCDTPSFNIRITADGVRALREAERTHHEAVVAPCLPY